MNWAEYFYYDETSPTCLRWKVTLYNKDGRKNRKATAGNIAGCTKASARYSVVRVRGKSCGVHRIIWQMFNRPLASGEQVDHIDGDTKNNRIANLRAATAHVNHRNMKKPSDNTSGYVGVTFFNKKDGQSWAACWTDLLGNNQRKHFAVIKHGYDGAFELAKAHRAAVVEEMNAQGAGYSERHGT